MHVPVFFCVPVSSCAQTMQLLFFVHRVFAQTTNEFTVMSLTTKAVSDAVRISSAEELDFSAVRVTCEINRSDLVHCVVRPEFDPPRSRVSQAAVDGQGYALDECQHLAETALADRESVVVSAPTSSGKTTVAISALNVVLRHQGAKAIFCAPIKALSNQMFSEFHARFPGNVGLMTGDHTIAPDSLIIVATTEITRCLLHADPDLVLKLHTVIFEEVHYLSDAERGAAWEESIVMLPPGVSTRDPEAWSASAPETPCVSHRCRRGGSPHTVPLCNWKL